MKYVLPAFWIIILICVGCRRLPDRPEDLPTLYPCEINVTFGGKTIEGVQVSLVSDSPELKKWRAGGVTDAEGNVVLKTSFCYEGVPEGTFVLSFSKSEERLGNTLEEMTPLSLIPLKYTPGKSKMNVTIKPEENKLQFKLDGGEERFPVPKGARQSPRMKR